MSMLAAGAQRTLGRLLPPWWLYLILGIAWTVVALIVLRFDYTSVNAIAILFGIVAIAATLKKATGHAFDGLGDEQALMLAVGVSVFILGDVLFRRALRIGPSANRLAVAILAPATIPLGTQVSAFAQLAALVALIVAALAAEQRPDRAGHGGGLVDEAASGDPQDAVPG